MSADFDAEFGNLDVPADKAGRIVYRACTSRPRFGDPDVARRAAWRFRHFTMHVVRAYRCPFDEAADPHWHVGHVESLPLLHRTASEMRERWTAA